MPCPVCNTKRLVEIMLQAGQDELVLRSCSGCDTRWWERNGKPVPLDGVLNSATRR